MSFSSRCLLQTSFLQTNCPFQACASKLPDESSITNISLPVPSREPLSTRHADIYLGHVDNSSMLLVLTPLPYGMSYLSSCFFCPFLFVIDSTISTGCSENSQQAKKYATREEMLFPFFGNQARMTT